MMKKLLIPTDFSEASKNSILYAFSLATKIGLEVQLVNVLELYKFVAGTSEAELISTILPADNIEEMEASARQSFSKLIDETKIDQIFSVKFDTKVISGHLVNEMIVESGLNDIEMMVLAVAGNTELSTRFSNSTISAIITDSACPVIVVPSGCEFKLPEKILLATDFNKADLELIKRIIALLGQFNPHIEVLHIATKLNDFKTELKFAGFKQLVTEQFSYQNISFKLVQNKNVVKGILDTLHQDQIDILLMLKEHESFLKSLFETSNTEKIAHYLKIPMISFQQSK